ncbi:MAG: hypothetical protein QOD64_1647 [Verrucomicrobiota bacterium]
MNIRNFSLDYIQPTDGGGAAVPVADPWADAVNYYTPHILKTLQEGGHKRVQDLFETIRAALNVPQLQLDQFVGVIDRMILNRQLTVVQPGQSPGEAVIALPLPG